VNTKASGPATMEDAADMELGLDIQEMVAKRLAVKNKKTVRLEELLRDTKFTKEEIRQMYRGFKQVSPCMNENSVGETPAKVGERERKEKGGIRMIFSRGRSKGREKGGNTEKKKATVKV